MFKQCLHVTFAADPGRWEAVNIAGNSGTPRGHFSWNTWEEDDTTADDIGQPTTARIKVGNGSGGESSSSGHVRYDRCRDTWFVWSFNDTPCPFSRVAEAEALEAAKSPDFICPY